MGEEIKHLPLPWEVGFVTKTCVYDANGDLIFFPDNDLPLRKIQANAAFIVTACNEHYALKEEVARLRTACQNFVDKVDRGEARSVKSYNEMKAALKSEDASQ